MECQRMLQAQGTAKSKPGNYRTLLLLLFGIETGNDKRGTQCRSMGHQHRACLLPVGGRNLPLRDF